MSDYTAQKPDANAAELTAYLRARGAVVRTMHRTDGHDVMVTLGGKHYVAEYKNPLTRWSLTPAEKKRRDEVENAGGIYYILLTIDDCAAMLDGLWSAEKWKAIGR